MIGPGYTPIPYKLVANITGGQLIELADLLLDDIKAQDMEPQAYLEGKLLVTGTKKQVVEVTDIVTWIVFLNFLFGALPLISFPLDRPLSEQVADYPDSKAFPHQILAPLRHRIQEGNGSFGFYRLVSHCLISYGGAWV